MSGLPGGVVSDAASQQNFDYLAKRISDSTSSATTKGFILHGEEAATVRPLGYGSVEWHGSVEPENWIDGDTWIEYP